MCWGERADEAKAFSPGERIKAFINVESREYNGKWFTDVKVWKFEKDGQSAPPPAATPASHSMNEEAPPASFDDDLPF